MSSSSIPAIIQLYIRNGPYDNPVQEERVPILSPEDVDIVTNMKKGRRELDIIGNGKFGTVYRATLLLDGKLLDVVVKHCPSASQESVHEEAQFVQRLHDTGFVPRLHGLVWDCHSYLEDGPCLVQALYADGVTLRRAMRDFVKLPRKIRRRVAWNMAVGLQAIHERGVLLNDIHDRNVLVDLTCPTRSIKYVDMGLATYGPNVLFTYSAPDRCSHLAPELRFHGEVSTKTDIYSLGCLFKLINESIDDFRMDMAYYMAISIFPEYRDLDKIIAMLQDDL
ncbi:hypothetical protein ACOMHN_010173 [Nucella lapillus]